MGILNPGTVYLRTVYTLPCDTLPGDTLPLDTLPLAYITANSKVYHSQIQPKMIYKHNFIQEIKLEVRLRSANNCPIKVFSKKPRRSSSSCKDYVSMTSATGIKVRAASFFNLRMRNHMTYAAMRKFYPVLMQTTVQLMPTTDYANNCKA